MKTAARLASLILSFLVLVTPVAGLAQGGNFGGKTVDGITIYLGVTTAAAIAKNYPPGSPERTMHGGIPVGGDWHHILIAIFDAKTGKRITDAEVTATVREVGLSGMTRTLEKVNVAGYTTYCNYFEMEHGPLYRIDLSIRLPGRPGPIKTEFDYGHVVD